MPEKFSAIQNSTDLSESAYPLAENQGLSSLKDLNDRAIERNTQIKYREKLEANDHQNA